MRFEFLADGKTLILALAALTALAVLAAGFVYPKPYTRRLSALRFSVLILFFAGAVSLSLVYSSARSGAPKVFLLIDRSISMDIKEEDGRSRAEQANAGIAEIENACESAGIQVKRIFFAEESSEQSSALGDRRTTRFSPALSNLLEIVSLAEAGSPSRAVLISDGAAADEPLIDPYLSALLGKSVPVDVWPVGTLRQTNRPKLFFRSPPPSIATAGDSVGVEVGVISADDVQLTAQDGPEPVAALRVPHHAETADLFFVPRAPGLRTVTVRAENKYGSSVVRFRMKVLPRLVFELSGRPGWDARYFMVAAKHRPGVSARGRWTEKFSPGNPPGTISVVFGSPSQSISPDRPIVFWIQSPARLENAPRESAAELLAARGVRSLGRESGSFMPAVAMDGSGLPAPGITPNSAGPARLPPIAARHKLALDLSWIVRETYPDGTPFLAERADTGSAPAFLVNAEGLWRWWVNPIVWSANPEVSSAPAYERFLDRLMAWARATSFPPAELFALQDAGQIGTAMEWIALFSTPPSSIPKLKIISENGTEQEIYGTGTTAVRYSYVPSAAGSYRAAIGVQDASGTVRRLEQGFQVSDSPFDLAYPEPRADLLRRIAARTGGRVMAQPSGVESMPQLNTHDLVTDLESVQITRASTEDQRTILARTPGFFAVLVLLFAALWTLESRWLR